MAIVNEDGIPILGEDDAEDTRLIDICLVSHENIPVTFAYDLAQMHGFTAAHLPDGVHLGMNLIHGTYVHAARQELMEVIRNRGTSWTLWLDTDMRFPKDTLVRLINHQQPVVGINYAKRRVPTDYVAIKKLGLEDGERSQRLATTDESEGLEEVEAMGFGACLIRGDVIMDLPELTEGPWFDIEWLPERGQWIGEDVSFFRLVREKLGYRLFVDHDLSKECAHIGQWEYRLEHVLPEEEQPKA